MPTYVFTSPEGKTYEINGPEGSTHAQAFDILQSQLGVKTKQDSSFGADVLKGAKGTAAAVGDIASGLLKVPAAAMIVAGDTLLNPGQADLQTRWEGAQKAMEDTFPSFGQGMEDNKGYTAPLYPFEKYAEGAQWVAKKISNDNRDVEGAVNIASNFAPIPFLGRAGKAGKKVLETIDPGLRTTKAPEIQNNVRTRTDAVVKAREQAQELSSFEQEAQAAAEAKYRDDATAQRLEAAIAKQNPPQETLYGNKRGEVLTPDNLLVENTIRDRQNAKDLAEVSDAILADRQKAIEDQVARQTTLERNAAERARQENAPTGYQEWVDHQRQLAEQRQRGNNSPMEMDNPYPVDASQFPQVLKEAPYKHENGIPYDQPMLDKSLPLEVRDALGPKTQPDPFNRYSQNQAARRILIEGEHPPIIKGGMRGGRRGGVQGGAIDPKVFEDLYKFGKSVIRGVEGALLPLYHGTDKEFRTIRATKEGGALGNGVYLAVRPEYASGYAEGVGGNIHQVYANIKRPLVIDGPGDPMINALMSLGETREKATKIVEKAYDEKGYITNEVRARAMRQGYDGIVQKRNGKESEVVAFHPDQVKSAISGDAPATKIPTTGPTRGAVTPEMHNILTLGIPKLAGMIKDRYGDSVGKFIDSQMEAVKRGYKSPTDYLRRLPGMADQADSLVTRPTPSKDLVAKAAAEADGPGLWNNMQSGLTSASEKMRSTMVKNASEWFNWSQNRANYVIREAIYPLEKMYASMGNKLEDLHYVMHTEMFQRQRFTDAELQSMGLHQKTLDAYKATRDVFEALWTEQNRARVALGKKELTRQDAYMASVFRGDYHIPVYDKSGKLRFYFQTQSKRQAVKAIDWMKSEYANHPEIDVSGLKYNEETMFKAGGKFGSVPRDVMSSWKDIIDALGDDPVAAELDAAMKQWVSEKGSEAFRQDLHHTTVKANVRGFEGDQPWLSSRQSAHNWAKAQVDYMKQAARWSSAQEAISNVKEFMTNPEIIDNQPNNIALTKAYLYNHMGLTENLARRLEVGLAKSTGVSRSSIKSLTEALRAGVYIKTLTANAGYMISTPFQAIPASLSWFVREGLEGNVKVNMGQFTLDMLQAATPDGFKLASTKNKAALDWAYNNGVIQNVLFEDGKSIGSHPIADKLVSFSDKTISLPDHWTRRMVFLPFANALEASGKYATKEAAWRRAGEISDQIAVSMREQDRPLAIQKAGMVGTMAYTMHAPIFNMYNNLSAQIRYAKLSDPKTVAPLLTYLGGMVAVGGLTALPAAQELLKAYDLLRKVLSKAAPEKYPTFDPRTELLKALPDVNILGLTGGEALAYGGASAVLGTDMRSRFSNEIVDSEKILSSMIPGIGIYGDMVGSAAKTAMNPNAQTFAQLAKDFAPGSLARGQVETNMPQFKAPIQAHASQGITSYRNPNDLDSPDVHVNRTPDEESRRKIGLTHITEAVRREKDARNRSEDFMRKEARDNLVEKLYHDIGNKRVDSDSFTLRIKKYVELDGDPNQLMTQLESKLAGMALSPQEKAIMKAKTQAQIMSVARRQQMNVQ
jgi:hypothetical protein